MGSTTQILAWRRQKALLRQHHWVVGCVSGQETGSCPVFASKVPSGWPLPLPCSQHMQQWELTHISWDSYVGKGNDLA